MRAELIDLFLSSKSRGDARVIAHGRSIISSYSIAYFENTGASAIEKMLITDTVPLPDSISRERLQVVSVAPLFGKAIDSIVSAKSISSLLRSHKDF